ncbi:MAG: hypothetical protein IT552_07645 [Sphingomonadaceae bacterium]|jgi:hypothetical protein|nr:hypothetical protein [Sphingomonadaceae bacterium]
MGDRTNRATLLKPDQLYWVVESTGLTGKFGLTQGQVVKFLDCKYSPYDGGYAYRFSTSAGDERIFFLHDDEEQSILLTVFEEVRDP